MTPRLLAGPEFELGAERLASHLERLGPLPDRAATADLIGTLETSGLLGRGGAGFPVGKKWRSVAERAGGGGAVVLVNGAEGEPLSHKDRALMSLRPHLVLDGAELAAAAVGADEIVLYVGAAHAGAQRALGRAVAERAATSRPRSVRGSATGGASSNARLRPIRQVPIRLVQPPHRYVSGEESAAVHFVNAGDARPVTTPPRPYERGIGARPTVVQNVESLAYAALIARFGDDWFRSVGRHGSRGTALITANAPSEKAVVLEVELGATVGDVAAMVEPAIRQDDVQAVLLGGYFGGWLPAHRAWAFPLDPGALKEQGLSFGAGVIGFLSAQACPVRTTARIATYMAAQSAAQCGPCVYGLRSIADAATRIARLTPLGDDLANLERWAGQVRNRGACRHPDGAVGLLTHALETFGPEFYQHQRGRCSHSAQVAPVTRTGRVA
ncbi:MAG TPA: NADH-ubiquinone oxidoreductase-F iron-sulfur binding region domain-containing protein [Candidatus Limnocylindrales bacterium]|nr:NADH-ubiquinone oxidoreductase-F iron-sulfur binding region domain-containing protein [Candidatus Limnocylindrales bacterium]